LVIPVKIFEIVEEFEAGFILEKLKNFHEEELYRTKNEENLNLVTEVLDLELKDNLISGIFSKDFISKRYYRRELIETPVTEEAIFWIKPYKGRIFILISAPSVARGVKKLLTNYIANKLSKVLFITPNAILEVRIPHSILKELHESNPQATKLIWFDDVDIPGIEKLCLAGSDLVDSNLYNDTLNHGKIWYVVFEVQNRGLVIGITRNCVITLFSKSEIQDFVNYVIEDILSLIE
jgi:hypothetical protein